MTHGTTSRTLSVGALARIEGEAAMHVSVRDGVVEDVALRIYEPPRFFEAFLRGRGHTEPPDITARICGICPVAYQMSACQAIEDACGVRVEGALRDLRRLLYCGEWIESHALHIYMLHAPDFLGYPSAVHMARDHRAVVERGLDIKKTGNEILTVVGGRAIHPVNVRVGGFHRAPSPAELRPLRERLLRARDAALDTVRWVASFDFPDVQGGWEMLALRHPTEYPMLEGRLVSSGGLDAPVHDFERHVVESHVRHSTALHGSLAGGAHHITGPLARYSLNFDRLPALARTAALAAGLGEVCRNPFQSIVVRAVELLVACDEALHIVETYEPPARPFVDVPARAGRGCAATEAPRGTLYHRYDLDAEGTITSAVIVPPTAQNQAAIEDDLRGFVAPRLHLDDAELTRQCEMAIRNHDPCISCATHFLDLTVERR
ncbi:MAG TPA: nickel-dependent hydrogenase large subunit [Candidatus Dormibacteraeota bacterium]|nr:nickel-dependent hydrogenase large subunit [Candidatus Dormibacteraeota bacterium]